MPQNVTFKGLNPGFNSMQQSELSAFGKTIFDHIQSELGKSNFTFSLMKRKEH